MKGQFEIGQINPMRYFFGIAVLLGFLFAFIAPDENDTANIFVLLIHWQLQSILPMAFLIISHLALHRFQLFNLLNPWLQLVSSGLMGVMLYAPLGIFLDLWFQEENLTSGPWLIEWLSECLALGPPILAAWVVINAPWIVGFRISHLDDELADTANPAMVQKPSNSTSVDAPFMQLMPKAIGRKVLYLQAELHYLKVVTDLGSALILYNLKDAVLELEAVKGFQCHRSYWVSLGNRPELKREGRQGRLILSNGESIPVSRNCLAKAKEIIG